MFYFSADWLVDWLIDWIQLINVLFFGWLIDWLIDWIQMTWCSFQINHVVPFAQIGTYPIENHTGNKLRQTVAGDVLENLKMERKTRWSKKWENKNPLWNFQNFFHHVPRKTSLEQPGLPGWFRERSECCLSCRWTEPPRPLPIRTGKCRCGRTSTRHNRWLHRRTLPRNSPDLWSSQWAFPSQTETSVQRLRLPITSKTTRQKINSNKAENILSFFIIEQSINRSINNQSINNQSADTKQFEDSLSAKSEKYFWKINKFVLLFSILPGGIFGYSQKMSPTRPDEFYHPVVPWPAPATTSSDPPASCQPSTPRSSYQRPPWQSARPPSSRRCRILEPHWWPSGCCPPSPWRIADRPSSIRKWPEPCPVSGDFPAGESRESSIPLPGLPCKSFNKFSISVLIHRSLLIDWLIDVSFDFKCSLSLDWLIAWWIFPLISNALSRLIDWFSDWNFLNVISFC